MRTVRVFFNETGMEFFWFGDNSDPKRGLPTTTMRKE